MKHIFGPVPSRRLGLSLGVDIVPLKKCSLDCVYCECGETNPGELVLERAEYIAFDEIISEINQALLKHPGINFITITGSGEPTLSTEIGRVIDYIKDNYTDYKVALLTNSTLLWDPEVRKEILRADIVLPSLDAVSEDVFQRINRPYEGLTAARMIEGLIDFRKEYNGTIWLELFIIPGYNDHIEELTLLKEKIELIKPDSVQLNTLDRPGVLSDLEKAPAEQLEEIKRFFAPLPVEIIARYRKSAQVEPALEEPLLDDKELHEEIIATLKRRPSTIIDLVNTLNGDKEVIARHIETLVKEGLVISKVLERGEFFSVKDGEHIH